MNVQNIHRIAHELGVQATQVQAATELLDDGATVPFISQYRKEATGSLDEVAVSAVRDRLEQLRELEKRREAILKSLDERNLLTDELQVKISAADTLTVLEDTYLPFRPKRRTRATMARKKGLEPLAQLQYKQGETAPALEAARYIDSEKGVESVEEALAGARDIIAEWVNEDQQVREKMRALFFQKSIMRAKVLAGKEEAGIKFRDYYEWEEPVVTAPSHRVLAMRRGEHEKVLSLRLTLPEDEAVSLMESLCIQNTSPAAEEIRTALRDCYKRLLCPSMEAEIRVASKKKADEEAIRVFVENLRELLLSPPLGQKNVMAIDPGFRTGCNVVCLDRQGTLLHSETVYPNLGAEKDKEAASTIRSLCRKFSIEAIAIGNGTAGRETEAFVRGLGLPDGIGIVMVNESGASIYSASDAAREKFLSMISRCGDPYQ